MPPTTPFTSRSAAVVIACLAALHAIVAVDLFLNLFPATDEFVAMWGIALWAKILWAIVCLLGVVAAWLLYRRAGLGLLAAVGFSACLYVASIELWGSVKGGFWLAVAATGLAGIGAVRSRSALPASHSGRSPWLAGISPSVAAMSFLFCAAFAALICLNSIIYFCAKLVLGTPWVGSDAIVAVFGAAMALLTLHFYKRYRGLRGLPQE